MLLRRMDMVAAVQRKGIIILVESKQQGVGESLALPLQKLEIQEGDTGLLMWTGFCPKGSAAITKMLSVPGCPKELPFVCQVLFVDWWPVVVRWETVSGSSVATQP